MMVHRVSLDAFTRIMATFDKRIEGAIIRGLRSAGHRLQGFTTEEIEGAEPYPAVDRGVLRGSVEFAAEPDGCVVYVDAPHAAVMEEGARPFFPPLEPLIAWVLRKRLAEDEASAKRIAWAIREKMGRVGIAPRGYMAKAFQRVLPVVVTEVERELSDL